MSRIDEALRRAEQLRGEPAETPIGASDPVPASGVADVFQDAWPVETEAPAPVADTATRPRPPLVAVPKDPEPPALHEARTHAHATATPDDGKGRLALFRDFHPSLAEKLVATSAIRPAFVEQYRRLGSTLHHAQIERGIKIVMVTSALASEGKSLTSTNTALTLSESYRRSVLLIDADLRRPSLHETFQVPNVAGLGDGLRAGREEKLSLVEISPRLTLLTAGRPDPDPMSGLTSDRMKQVLDEAAATFDWVIVDTPPVGLLPDANLMARMVDSALLVVQAGRTPYKVVQRAVAAIGRDRILGIVLNRADETLDTSYSYYRYNQAYGKKESK